MGGREGCGAAGCEWGLTVFRFYLGGLRAAGLRAQEPVLLPGVCVWGGGWRSGEWGLVGRGMGERGVVEVGGGFNTARVSNNSEING